MAVDDRVEPWKSATGDGEQPADHPAGRIRFRDRMSVVGMRTMLLTGAVTVVTVVPMATSHPSVGGH